MGLKHVKASQAAKPHGFLSRFVGRAMSRSNLESNKWMVSQMDLNDEDNVLEIGFGPGTAIQDMLEITKNGHVSGIDISSSMIDQATHLNGKAVKDGRLDLRLGEVTSMPWSSNSFEKALAVNIIYLWPILDPILNEIKRVLKPNGMLALYLAPIERVKALGFSELDLFTIHTPDEVEKACIDSGFEKVERTSSFIDGGTGISVKAWK